MINRIYLVVVLGKIIIWSTSFLLCFLQQANKRTTAAAGTITTKQRRKERLTDTSCKSWESKTPLNSTCPAHKENTQVKLFQEEMFGEHCYYIGRELELNMRFVFCGTGCSHLTLAFWSSEDCKGLTESIRVGSALCYVSFPCTHRSGTKHKLKEGVGNEDV